MMELRDFTFEWMVTRKVHTIRVPSNWPEDCLPEICAFRLGLPRGDIYEFTGGDVGRPILIATGTGV